MERNVLEKIVERGKMPVLFIGSGISKRYLYRYPNWEQLLKNSFKYIDQTSFSYEKHLDELKRQGITQFEVYTQLGSYAEAEFNAAFFEKRIKIKGTGGNKRPAWIERGISPYKMYLSRMFKDMKLYRNGTLLEELDKFRSLKNKVTAVITTNYDQFLEKEVFNSDFSVFIDQSELFSADSYNIAEIYKIHGCVTNANSIIITRDDYDNFEESRKLIIAKMLTLFTEAPLIFMGYSFTDENVQKIISDFVGCLNHSQIKTLDQHFVFISYEKGESELIETKTNIMTSSGTYIPITEIKTDNFGLIFDILNNIVPGVSPLRIRQTKKIIKKIVDQSISSLDAESIIVGLDKLDDMDLSGKPLAIAVGYRESVLQKYGYGMLSDEAIIEDILYDNKNFDPEQMCFERYRRMTINRLLPVFKYVKGIESKGKSIPSDSKLGEYIDSHNSIEKIIPHNIEKALKNIPIITSINSLEEEISKVVQLNKKAGILLKNIAYFKSSEIRKILMDLFEMDKDSAMKSTNFKRCIMILDLIENMQNEKDQ